MVELRQETFYGDAYVTLIGANNVGSIYGGGCDFTSTTYGNVYVDVQNSTINGNIYGGGLNGNVRKDSSQNGGNVSLNIQNSKILGNILWKWHRRYSSFKCVNN